MNQVVNEIDFVKYVGASGDFNPVHTVKRVTLEQGHPAVLAPGLFIMGIVSKAIEEWHPNQVLEEFSVRFMKPVYPGMSLYIMNSNQENETNYTVYVVDDYNEYYLKGYYSIR